MQFGLKMSFFKPFEDFNLKMKKVKYSVYQKLITTMTKNIYHIKNLRTSKFYGIYGFLWLVFITHNLISSFKATILRGTKLENVGVRVLVRSIGSIKAFVERTSRGINVNIPSITRLSRLIADAICGPRYIQLSFNI